VTRLDVAGVQPDDANRALRYLWARSRIAELSDYGSSQADADRIGDITSLGLKYNLLTQYTSFIAVLEVVEKHPGSGSGCGSTAAPSTGVSDLQ